MFNKTSLFIFLLSFCLSFWSCKPKNTKAQFYYWKQNVTFNARQLEVLEQNSTSKLYVKFFDIENSKPVSKVTFEKVLNNMEIIPCIYITNQSIEKEVNIEKLAQKTSQLLKQILSKNNIEAKEIQIDCDWTTTTKNKYFNFLTALQKELGVEIEVTSTLRLHQLKYYNKTGVPPVKKVTLMCYNLGDIQNPNEVNSIFTITNLEKYINQNTSYPLKMDFALPVFSWAVVYRFNHLALIVNNTNLEELENNSNIKKLENNTFKVINNHYFNNNYLYKDDIIRHEAVRADDLKKAIQLFKKLKDKNSELLFFDISNINALNYNNEDYKNIISKF